MRVNNQTSDPVDWEQNGGSQNEEELDPDCPKKGHLQANESSPEFKPCGRPPFEVKITPSPATAPVRIVEVKEIQNSDAVVTVTSFPLVQ